MSARFAGCPNSRHKIRIGFNNFKSTALQSLWNVIGDVIAVIRLVEHAPEVLHHSAKCGAVIQLNRISEDQHTTRLQHAPGLIQHLLARLTREFME